MAVQYGLALTYRNLHQWLVVERDKFFDGASVIQLCVYDLWPVLSLWFDTCLKHVARGVYVAICFVTGEATVGR